MTKPKQRYSKCEHINPEVVIEYYTSGKTQLQCADRFGVSFMTIKETLLENGVQLRTLSESQKLRWDKRREQEADTRQQVVSMYQSGISGIEISNRLGEGWSTPKIYDVLIEAGIPRRKYRDYCQCKTDTLSIDEIKRLYLDKQLSCNEIGYQYDISGQTIRKLLHKAGVKMRTAAEAVRIAHAKRHQKQVEKTAPKRLETTDAPVETEIVRLRTETNAMIQDIAVSLDTTTPHVFSVLSEAGML